MATLPFIRPDGTPTLVDRAHSQDAVNSGYKPAMRLARPDGSQTTVAFDDLHHALAAGYKQIGDNSDASVPDPNQAGVVGSLVRGLKGFGSAVEGAAQGLYHVAGDPAVEGHPLANALAMASGVPQLSRLLVKPQIQQGQQAAQDFHQGNVSQGIGHSLAAVTPGAGPLAAGLVDSTVPDIASGNYAGAAGKVAGTLATAELARRAVNAAIPTPTNLTPEQIAARQVAKAVLPREGDFDSLTNALQREKGNVEQYSADKGLTTRTPIDTSVAARESANDLNGLYTNQILAPHATAEVPIPINFNEVGTAAPSGLRTATLGQIDSRVEFLNDLLRKARNNPTPGQTMTDIAQMADKQAEASALTDILHNKLGQLSGIDPAAIAGVRQSVGARYELADQLGASGNRSTLSAGRQAATGSTISKPTAASLVIDTINRMRGGPEAIAARNFSKAYPKLNVPPTIGNPASIGELQGASLANAFRKAGRP
jgi:hypothetical protein